MKSNKWECDRCGEKFKTKKELVDHLRDELDEAEMIVDNIVGQLEYLGVKELYE